MKREVANRIMSDALSLFLSEQFHRLWPAIDEIKGMLRQVIANQGVDMSALTDLEDAVVSLTNAVTSEGNAIMAAITALQNAMSSGAVAAADVENAVTAIKAAVGNMNSQADSLNAVLNPPPPP